MEKLFWRQKLINRLTAEIDKLFEGNEVPSGLEFPEVEFDNPADKRYWWAIWWQKLINEFIREIEKPFDGRNG